jgi:uncharacterized Fe-S radical SAM superfamily protein PflX
MNYSAWKHNLKWDSFVGTAARYITGELGRLLLKAGQRLLKYSLAYCSLCGRDCGMDSTVSRKGLRCSSLKHHCTDIE